jgi:hypothetical protein
MRKAPAMTRDAATDKRKTAHTIRSGSITVTIWKN